MSLIGLELVAASIVVVAASASALTVSALMRGVALSPASGLR